MDSAGGKEAVLSRRAISSVPIDDPSGQKGQEHEVGQPGGGDQRWPRHVVGPRAEVVEDRCEPDDCRREGGRSTACPPTEFLHPVVVDAVGGRAGFEASTEVVRDRRAHRQHERQRNRSAGEPKRRDNGRGVVDAPSAVLERQG